jgi:hypothetical protein
MVNRPIDNLLKTTDEAPLEGALAGPGDKRNTLPQFSVEMPEFRPKLLNLRASRPIPKVSVCLAQDIILGSAQRLRDCPLRFQISPWLAASLVRLAAELGPVPLDSISNRVCRTRLKAADDFVQTQRKHHLDGLARQRQSVANLVRA